jgi:hypothetical protein
VRESQRERETQKFETEKRERERERERETQKFETEKRERERWTAADE